MLRILSLISLALLCSCSKPESKKAPAHGPSTGKSAGSCLGKDPTANGALFCYENDDKYAESTCRQFGQTWSDTACNAKQYQRRCQSVSQVSINDGPETDVHETYYFPAGSTMACAGTETIPDAAPSATPKTRADEPLKDGIQIMEAVDVKKVIQSLGAQEVEINQVIIWGGTLKKGSATFHADPVSISLETSDKLRFEAVSLATPEGCLRAIGMGMRYGVDNAPLTGMFFPYELSDGILTQIFDPFEISTQDVDGDRLIISRSVDQSPEDRANQDCPFIASFRLVSGG